MRCHKYLHVTHSHTVHKNNADKRNRLSPCSKYANLKPEGASFGEKNRQRCNRIYFKSKLPLAVSSLLWRDGYDAGVETSEVPGSSLVMTMVKKVSV